MIDVWDGCLKGGAWQPSQHKSKRESLEPVEYKEWKSPEPGVFTLLLRGLVAQTTEETVAGAVTNYLEALALGVAKLEATF